MRRLLSLFLLAFALGAGAAEPWEKFFDLSLGDLRAEVAEAAKAGKQGLLVMYQFEECPYCARMKREVLSRPDVQRAYRSRFQAIEIDTRGSQEITGFDGKTMPEKDFARASGIRGSPVFVFYSLEGKAMLTHAGAINDPASFILLADYYSTGAYRDTPFIAYVRAHRKGA